MQKVIAATAVAVVINNVYYSYNTFLVLNNISFTVNEGDLLRIIGPNGAGKSKLFGCMLGLVEDYKGQITIFGKDIQKNRKVLQGIGYIPQQRSIEETFPATVKEIVSLGITQKNTNSFSKNKEKIISAIKIVDLSQQRNKRIGELSGGQQQRVLIAKSLVNDPKLLILDEPTTSVDQETQNKLYALIKKLNKEKKISIIWTSHDLDAVNRLTNKVACINRSMFFHGDTHEFFQNEKLLKTYSEPFIQAHMQVHLNKDDDFNNNSNNNCNSRGLTYQRV
jgi:zinc transport system ATP-binding protein